MGGNLWKAELVETICSPFRGNTIYMYACTNINENINRIHIGKKENKNKYDIIK